MKRIDLASKSMPENVRSNISRELAVVGLSFSMPGASTLDEFWDICSQGTDCIREIPYRRKTQLER